MRERAGVGHALSVLILCVLTGLGTAGHAYVNLKVGSHSLYWADPLVGFVLHTDADPNITDGSDEAAVRLAFQTWEQIPTSSIRFAEDTDPASRARTDWRSDDVHLVMWDQTNESGFFDDASGLVSITPVDFNPHTGELLDADILVNGKRSFSTDMRAGTYDIQALMTHEVGHLIGLDHTGVLGATMTPVPVHADTRPRSLELDDIAGASALYPVSPTSAIEGYVRRAGRPVSGAHVVAENSNGEPASSTLTDSTGHFRIDGITSGSYVVYAEPLDGPLHGHQLSLYSSGLVVQTDFGTTFWGPQGRSSPAQPTRVSVGGGTTALGTIETLEQTRLNLRKPVTTSVTPGSQTRLSFQGSWLYGGRVLDIPGAAGEGLVLTNQSLGFSSARVDVFVPATALPRLGSVRIYDPDTWACTVLTGGFEIQHPRPTITQLSSTSGQPGEVLTLFGSDLQQGARVLFGPEVLSTSGSGDQVSLSVPRLPNGTYTLVLENPDGQVAVALGAFGITGSTSAPPNPTTPAGTTPPVNPTTPPPAPLQVNSGGSSGGCTLTPDQPQDLPLGLVFLAGVLLVLTRLRRPREQ